MTSRCLYCDVPLGTSSPTASASRGARQAYDPERGRLWKICSVCGRWNPVPLELRWESLEGWERRVRDEGEIVLAGDQLVLVRIGGTEVVRVGEPNFTDWGGWRYGTRLPLGAPRLNLLERALGSLPPAPLEGYDPYGLTGPLGGVGGKQGPTQWLASPFLSHARPLTVGFASVPFARECPGCRSVMPLQPWDFARVGFCITSDIVGVEADCGACGRRVSLDLRSVRPALRMGLAILDSDRGARSLGDHAGVALDQVGGVRPFLRGLGRLAILVGELDRLGRIGLAIALDVEAEAEALEREWGRAEELAAIMDGELTEVEGFREFRARVLSGSGSL